MKFLAITLITHVPDPITGIQKSTTERLRDVVANAVLAEELGFDGYGVGERHERPFISSSPPVVLSHIAACTSTIRLFTTVTTLSLLDPVRAFEDYATLDHLSSGRLELIIGKGNGAAQARLFHVTTEDQWERNREGYELFRRWWREDRVTWCGQFRPSLDEAETWPRPLQQPVRVWHGSAAGEEPVALVAKGRAPALGEGHRSTRPRVVPGAFLPGTLGVPRSGPRGGLAWRRYSRLPRRQNIPGSHRNVPPDLRRPARGHAPARHPAGVPLARGCHRAQFGLDRQPAADHRQGASVPRAARARGAPR